MIVHGSVHGSMLPWCLSSLECFIVDLQLCQNHAAYFVGNKEKKKISKRVFQETKARKMFGKTNIFNHLIRTRTCAYQGVRKVHFSENLASLVFLNICFGIRPFALLTTIYHYPGYVRKTVWNLLWKGLVV